MKEVALLDRAKADADAKVCAMYRDIYEQLGRVNSSWYRLRRACYHHYKEGFTFKPATWRGIDEFAREYFADDEQRTKFTRSLHEMLIAIGCKKEGDHYVDTTRGGWLWIFT